LSDERFAAVNVQRLTGRERVRQGEAHACAMSSVVPIRLAGLRTEGISLFPLAAAD
jgi:hypothetical protein